MKKYNTDFYSLFDFFLGQRIRSATLEWR